MFPLRLPTLPPATFLIGGDFPIYDLPLPFPHSCTLVIHTVVILICWTCLIMVILRCVLRCGYTRTQHAGDSTLLSCCGVDGTTLFPSHGGGPDPTRLHSPRHHLPGPTPPVVTTHIAYITLLFHVVDLPGPVPTHLPVTGIPCDDYVDPAMLLAYFRERISDTLRHVGDFTTYVCYDLIWYSTFTEFVRTSGD